jgi:hypothetical protein
MRRTAILLEDNLPKKIMHKCGVLVRSLKGNIGVKIISDGPKFIGLWFPGRTMDHSLKLIE